MQLLIFPLCPLPHSLYKSRMNPYLLLLLVALGGSYALDLTAELLNLGRLNDGLPKEFEGFFDPEKYQKSLAYQRTNTRFGILRETIMIAGLLIFLFAGGFECVDSWARAIGFKMSWGGVRVGLVFAGAISLLRFLLQLPFSIYHTFVIEEKYGFNKTTVKTYLLDLMKGAVLIAILGGAVFGSIVWFFEKSGSAAWIYAWISVTVFQLVLVYLAPVFILPLFNKFTPLAESELKSAVEAFARKQNFQLSGIFMMDSSKRSTKSNAYFTGFGRFRRLVLFDTLAQKQTVEELIAVVAHEVGHFKRKHIVKFTIISILSSGLMFYLFSLFLNNPELFAAFRVEHVSVYASVIFVSLLYGPLMRPLSFFTQILSRKFEFEADDYSLETYGKPEMLVSALKKLSVDNMSHLTPHPLKVALDYTHPPILRRIAAIRAKMQST